MQEIVYYLSKSYLYLALFPVFAILLLAILYFIFRRSINNNNISLYGIFLSYTKKDILSLSLILLEFIIILETMFITKFSYFSILYIFTPILIYAIINMDLINMIINILGVLFISVLCFFERTFLSYILYIDNMWYVIILFVGVCILIVLLNTYMMIRNINILSKKRIKKEKIKIMGGVNNEKKV